MTVKSGAEAVGNEESKEMTGLYPTVCLSSAMYLDLDDESVTSGAEVAKASGESVKSAVDVESACDDDEESGDDDEEGADEGGDVEDASSHEAAARVMVNGVNANYERACGDRASVNERTVVEGHETTKEGDATECPAPALLGDPHSTDGFKNGQLAPCQSSATLANALWMTIPTNGSEELDVFARATVGSVTSDLVEDADGLEKENARGRAMEKASENGAWVSATVVVDDASDVHDGDVYAYIDGTWIREETVGGERESTGVDGRVKNHAAVASTKAVKGDAWSGDRILASAEEDHWIGEKDGVTRSFQQNCPHREASETREGVAPVPATKLENPDHVGAAHSESPSVVSEQSKAPNGDAPEDGGVRPREDDESSSVAEYERLFTTDELDRAEAGETESVEPEPEEYDKELEDRLYPLDEVELRRRMKENASRLEKPTLEALSEILGIPVETLERTREGSPGKLATPEYWQEWFTETLQDASEAKRANRDFKTAGQTVTFDPEAFEPGRGPRERDVKAIWSLPVQEGRDLAELEADVVANLTGTVSEDSSPPPEQLNADSYNRKSLRKSRRAAARYACYRTIKVHLAFPERSRDVDEGEDALKFLMEHLPSDPSGVDPGTDNLDRWLSVYLTNEGESIRARLRERANREVRPVSVKPKPRHVTFDVSSLFPPRSEAIDNLRSRPDSPEDVSHYVAVVRPVPDPPPKPPEERNPGLVAVDASLLEGEGVPGLVCPVVASGHRVIGSVGTLQALSSGSIECVPTTMLVDTGATASLVDRRVLRLLGKLKAPVRPYEGSLNSSSGHKIRTHGVIELSVRLGSREIKGQFVVADQLHVDAILGTDVLEAFRAVIDVAAKEMTLKGTEDVISLGAMTVEETYEARAASTFRLRAGGQALVSTHLRGRVPDGTVVLMEGAVSLDNSLRVARSLSTAIGGKAVVELCNATTDEIVVKKGALLAVATVIPESAFDRVEGRGAATVARSDKARPPDLVDAVTKNSEMPGLSVPEEELEVDFSDSKLTVEQQDILRAELSSFRDLFVDSSKAPGRTDLLQFEIDTGNSRPIKQPPYRVSKAEGDVMEAEIQQYLELGIIRPSSSPWASPVLMIRKPDGGIRFCIDYRRLNSVTVKDCYPMPLIDDILDVLGQARLFSTMDIASGYWNVPMAPGSVEKTAFACKFGLYEWLVMPFGLCNAVPAFERLMETVLVDLKWRTCLVYLDDCVVFSDDFPTHLVRLRQVLERFRAAGFRLKMKKCHWGRSQVAFLGHIITPSGILPNPEKVKSVLNVARPHNLHTLRAFLGLSSYFRRYIPGYAGISAPLERLKVKDATYRWSDDCEDAFLQLKRSLVKPPILIYPDFNKRFKLYVDSSKLAVGACLMQEENGRDRAVAYASKLLVGSQKNWICKDDGITEIECWGVVWATRKFRPYLDREEFDLFTDHKALTWVFSEGNRTGNSKLARWAMELSQLRFKVHHKAGTLMGHVDGLSRLLPERVSAIFEGVPQLDDAEDQDLVLVGEYGGEGDANGPETSVLVGEPSGMDDEGSQIVEGQPTSPGGIPSYGPSRESGGIPSYGRSRSPVSLPDEELDGSGGLPDLARTMRTEPEPLLATPPTQEEMDLAGETEVVNPLSPIDEVGLDQERFVEEQMRTPWMRALIAFLIDGALPLDPQLRVKIVRIAPRFVMRDGILRRWVHLPARIGPARSLTVPVVPVVFIVTVLHYCHADIFSAHMGRTKTIEKVKRHTYWNGWRRDATEFVRACSVCGSGKGYRPWSAGLMQRMPVVDLNGPFSMLVVDAIGPLPITTRGNQYILVFVDYFTRWAEAFAVASLDTLTFVHAMVDGVISRHGVPGRLLSDRGTNFTSALARSLYETLGIKKLFGAAYHPQTQGLVERFNGTLIGMLKMFVNEDQTDWDLYLPRVLFAYRTSYHEALGDSPFFSLYGRDPSLPLDLAFLNTGPVWKSDQVSLYRRKLNQSLRASRQLVERQLLKAQARHAKRMESQVAVSYEIGSPVWVYQFFRSKRGSTRTKKLAFAWHGPYRVESRIGPNVYRIAIPTHPDRLVAVNVNRLKPFRGRWSRPLLDEAPDVSAAEEGETEAATTPDDARHGEESSQGDGAVLRPNGPLALEDLPRTSFVERLELGAGDTAFSQTDQPILEIVGKRGGPEGVEYLALSASYETFWLARSVLAPEYSSVIEAYEASERKRKGLPELRRSVRLEEANEGVDDMELLL